MKNHTISSEDTGHTNDPAAASTRRLQWGMLLVCIILGLGIILLYLARIQRIRADTQEASNNLRSMSFALYEFESSYGSYPNADTAAAVKANTGTILPLGSGSSNDFFRQLMAAEISQSEGLFYAKIPGSRKPDHVFNDASSALVKGEVGFSYIVGLTSRDHPARPVVVTPLIHGTNRFDPKPFGGNAIVLRVNGERADVLPITRNGEVIDSSGKHILDPANPVWSGKTPVIAWPE